MPSFILYSVTFFGVLVVSSSFEVFSVELELFDIKDSKFKCLEEGRFPHPDNCGYIECVRNKEGNFKRRFGSCHGANFSSELKLCKMDIQSNDCESSARLPRSLATDRRISNLCSTVWNGFVCADCKTAVNCVDGVAYTEMCGAGDMCTDKQGFGGAVCYPREPAECTCVTSNEFQVDVYNHQMFFFCDAPGADPDFYHCPEDMEFDVASKQCINLHGLPVCTEKGVFADKRDCSQYYSCIYSKDGWVQKSFSCDSNLMYNEDTGMCEDPCGWDTGRFTCQAEGRFPDLFSCQHYYECVREEDGFRQHHRQCPDGFQWVANALGSYGLCLAGNDHCTSLKVSTCIIPEGQCSDPPVSPDSSTTACRPTRAYCPDCGVANINVAAPRIIGGADASPNEFPFQVSLDVNIDGIQYTCGGSIIKKKWILTSAFCLTVDGYLPAPNGITIRYGNAKRNETSSVTSVRYIIHENYDDLRYANNIALVELPSELNYETDDSIQPICLGEEADIPFGEKAVVAGWGFTDITNNNISNNLQKVALDIMTIPECIATEMVYMPTDNTTVLCTTTPNKNMCFGDRGSPLVVQLCPNRWVQIGIVSYDFTCNFEGAPNVYIKVSAYKTWIDENTGSSMTC